MQPKSIWMWQGLKWSVMLVIWKSWPDFSRPTVCSTMSMLSGLWAFPLALLQQKLTKWCDRADEIGSDIMCWWNNIKYKGMLLPNGQKVISCAPWQTCIIPTSFAMAIQRFTLISYFTDWLSLHSSKPMLQNTAYELMTSDQMQWFSTPDIIFFVPSVRVHVMHQETHFASSNGN